MKFHHMAIMVSNLDESIKLWRDVLGFRVDKDVMLPDGEVPGPNTFIYPAVLDNAFGISGASSRMVLLSSEGGAIIEIQQPINPPIQKTPDEYLTYSRTGIREIALRVDDIDSWYKKIKLAGYRIQGDLVWPCADLGRSFLFSDLDGNWIQLWESTKRENRPVK